MPEQVRGRDLLMARLEALIQELDGRAHVLAGLGGTGKSTVALRVVEVAVGLGRRVWWVPGVDASSLTSALLGLAQALGADTAQVEAARAGRVDPCDVLWPVLEADPGWVLVIDNADDVRALAVGGRPVRDGNGWVRSTRAGLVMVTTRDADPRHWGRGAELHPVGWLPDADGARVLLDLAPEAGTPAEAEGLSSRLGGLALALHHAGSQLASPFSQERTFTGYLRALETGFPALLASGGLDDREVVTSTWELSLDQLADAGVEQARGLLGVLVWFAGAVPIPVAGLDHQVLGQVCGEHGPAGVGVGLEALLSAGLIENRLTPGETPAGQAAGGWVMVHPLVAETTRHRLKISDAAGAAAAVAVELLAAATDELDMERPQDWPVWTAWMPHLDELLTYASPLLEHSSLATLATSSRNAVAALTWTGSYPAALELAKAGERHTQRLDQDHFAAIDLQYWQAAAHRFLGNAAEAEPLFREVLQVQERVLGSDHPDTLTTRHDIARAVAERGDTAEAERLYREVLQVRERVLGSDHPNTLTTRHEIARMVARRGDTAESERLHRELLQVRERVLGSDHPNTLTTRHDIARVVAERGDTAESERLFREVLQARERVLGSDHPHTLNTRHDFAWVVARRGDTAEAERLYREVLQAKERVLGSDHPNTLNTRHDIAWMVGERGDTAEAERLFREVLQVRERVLGSDHTSTQITARALRNLTMLTDDNRDG
ncbi:tetratricopeptide repeat protein [Streptomyces canus]|uniref:tetratricopeptide repeat protein n=1 Tax=Streptomyces canus TaxID=58343 RepID=UPI002DDB49F3|nr:tetratricopeptide repeat protein [Streptomyces canus]WSD86000.1 tetratricopeptide repeat protein [Streptomyces canus]